MWTGGLQGCNLCLVTNVTLHFLVTVAIKVVNVLWLTWCVGYTDVPDWTFLSC